MRAGDLVSLTGGTGFVGSHVADALLAAGYRVRALVRRPDDVAWLKGTGVDLVKGDVRDAATLPALVEGAAAVVHVIVFAVETEERSQQGRVEEVQTRLKLQQHGFDVFAGAKTVDAEIHAVAGELPLTHVAHFAGVGQTAAGADAEVGEDWMARVGVRDAELLRPGARAVAVDLVFIRRAPIMRRRRGNFR